MNAAYLLKTPLDYNKVNTKFQELLEFLLQPTAPYEASSQIYNIIMSEEGPILKGTWSLTVSLNAKDNKGLGMVEGILRIELEEAFTKGENYGYIEFHIVSPHKAGIKLVCFKNTFKEIDCFIFTKFMMDTYASLIGREAEIILKSLTSKLK